jgi:hypothetical protein
VALCSPGLRLHDSNGTGSYAKLQIAPVCTKHDLENLNPIAYAYVEGRLRPDGKVTIWYAGKLVIGPAKPNEKSLQRPWDQVEEWTYKYEYGRGKCGANLYCRASAFTS